MKKLIVIALIILTLTTCQHLQSVIQEPVVTLNSVELVNISFTGVEFLCKVNVENRSNITIPFPDIDWELFINDNSFIKGSNKFGGSIRSRRTNIVEVPISLGYVEFFNAFQSMRGNKSADYKIALGANLDIPVIGEKTWNFQHVGEFPLLQVPKITMPSMKIDGIDFSKIQLLFSVDIENPNVFQLPSPQIAYDFLINRNSFLSGVQISSAPLAAAAATPLVIALTLEYADLFRLFQNLINLNEVPGLLSLSGDFGVPALASEKLFQEITGSLPILKMPSISFRGISLKNLSLTRADFELSWEIENNNSFAMNIKDLSYNLIVNNSQWSSGNVTNAPQISANRRTIVPLEFSINSLSVVGEIANMVTRGTNINYACNGNMNLGAALPGLADFQTPFNFSGTTRLSR
ncbi:MAG: LEA type 2 family protein [Treponema sp.]|jgi:LEA14-like dessication related protein|nr:LEA type 2 family protein [Treponema sp.]